MSLFYSQTSFTISSSFLARPTNDHRRVGSSHPMASCVLLKLLLFFQLRPLHSPNISVPSCVGYPRPAVGYESIIGGYHSPHATDVCRGPGTDRFHSRDEAGQKWQLCEFILGGHLNVTHSIQIYIMCTGPHVRYFWHHRAI